MGDNAEVYNLKSQKTTEGHFNLTNINTLRIALTLAKKMAIISRKELI